jgi:DNA-binding GntR family transcriptional regulator
MTSERGRGADWTDERTVAAPLRAKLSGGARNAARRAGARGQPRAVKVQPASPREDDATRVYRRIFESVMSQRLTPGTKLPEVALCELFGVGRTLVRKVLQELAHDHIVELRPNRGAVVAAPSPEETREIFAARRALEAALLPMACANATRADVAALRRQLREEHATLHAADQPAWARLASSFHLQVAALGRNRILQQYLAELISRCSLIVALYEPPGNAACEHDEHARIVTLLEKRDAAGAIRVMDAHLLDLERRICLSRPASSGGLRDMLGI